MVTERNEAVINSVETESALSEKVQANPECKTESSDAAIHSVETEPIVILKANPANEKESKEALMNSVATELAVSDIDCHNAGEGDIDETDQEKKEDSFYEDHPLDNEEKDECRSQRQDTNSKGRGSHQFKKAHDNTMSEELVDQYSLAMKSVGYLVLPHGHGTIFRVGSKYGITAAHVIASGENMKNEIIVKLLGDPSVYVLFQRDGPKFRLKRRLLFINSNLDVAVLQFEDNQNLPSPFALCPHDIYHQIQEVSIIGAGHPTLTGKFLELDVKVVKQDEIPIREIENFLQQNKDTFHAICRISGVNFESLDQSYSGISELKNLLLNTFLGNGASGAPVVLKDKPYLVVGVFTCGYPRLFYELPSIRSSFPLKYTFEAATKTTCIENEIHSFDAGTWSELFQNPI